MKPLSLLFGSLLFSSLSFATATKVVGVRAFVHHDIAWVDNRKKLEDMRGIANSERLQCPEGGARTASERSVIKEIVPESFHNGIAPTVLSITPDTGTPKSQLPSAQRSPAAPIETAPDLLPPTGESLPEKTDADTLRVLLVGGGSSHDFERFFRQVDGATLKATGKYVTAYTANAPEAAALLAKADVLVLSANHPSFGGPEFQDALRRFADSGKGIVVVHAGTWYNWRGAGNFQRRFVGGGAKSHGKGEFQVLSELPEHPVMEGVPLDFTIRDEHYRVELEPNAEVEVLALTSVETASQKQFPSVWVVKDPKAKIVGIALGHGEEAHANKAYQRLLINAVRWAGNNP